MKDYAKAKQMLTDLLKEVDEGTADRLTRAFEEATKKELSIKAFVNGVLMVGESVVISLDAAGWHAEGANPKRYPTPELAAEAALASRLRT